MTDSTARDVYEALGNVYVCKVCNNGVTRNGWMVIEHATPAGAHCTICHVVHADDCHAGYAGDNVVYAHCFQCGELVNRYWRECRPAPAIVRALGDSLLVDHVLALPNFWDGHVCAGASTDTGEMP